MSGKKYKGFTPRWNKIDFNYYLQIADLLSEYKNRGEKLGYKKIAKILFKDLHQEKNAKEMMARRRLKVVNEHFLKIFHRDPSDVEERRNAEWVPYWRRSTKKLKRKI